MQRQRGSSATAGGGPSGDEHTASTCWPQPDAPLGRTCSCTCWRPAPVPWPPVIRVSVSGARSSRFPGRRSLRSPAAAGIRRRTWWSAVGWISSSQTRESWTASPRSASPGRCSTPRSDAPPTRCWPASTPAAGTVPSPIGALLEVLDTHAQRGRPGLRPSGLRLRGLRREVTDSEFERLVLRDLAAAGVRPPRPPPSRAPAREDPIELDLDWPGVLLDVELDGADHRERAQRMARRSQARPVAPGRRLRRRPVHVGRLRDRPSRDDRRDRAPSSRTSPVDADLGV